MVFFKTNSKNSKKTQRPEFTDINGLREFLRQKMQTDMESSPPKNLPEQEKEKYLLRYQRLRKALRSCIYGEGGEKDYVKAYLRNQIGAMELTYGECNRLLPVNDLQRLESARKFDILMYEEMKSEGKDAFLSFCAKHGLPKEVRYEDGDYYEITSADIDAIYAENVPMFSRDELLDYLTDYVYEGFGHGLIDRLRDCRLDGISGGVCGLPEQFYRYEEELCGAAKGTHSYDSVFVMFRGITVRMSFFSFGSEKELRRVTKSLLRYEAPGELSYYQPYMVNDMKDGSRVFACRPPFSESWAFFIRKFDSAEQKKPEELIVGEGAQQLIEALRFFVAGGLHLAITGTQGSGKTTLLKALVRYINPKYNLRIEESVFELWMRREFPRRNILTFRETESVDLTEGLNAFRKTDGNCLMMGEIVSIEVAALMIELGQVSEQQLFTHHAMSTEKLIDYFQNALLRTGAFSEETMAREQVMESFQIHVLCEKDLKGKRYIKQVCEICPDREEYRVLFSYTDGAYRFVEGPTERLFLRMEERLPREEKGKVRLFFQKMTEAKGMTIGMCE